MCICVEKTPIKVSPLLSKKVVYKRGRPVARICRPTMVGKVGGVLIGDVIMYHVPVLLHLT